MKFLKLTPTDNADISGYVKAIEFALKEKDIENIALTGGYGTGKSSIIKSFFNDKSDKTKPMYINLGSYDHDLTMEKKKTDDKDDETNDRKAKEINSNITINNLEEKIISQVMQQIDKNKIPESLFRIKENEKWYRKIINYFKLFILFLLISYIFLPSKYNPISLLLGEVSKIVHIIILFLFIGTISYVVFQILNEQRIANLFKRINLYGNEIEFSEKEDYSYFDKYMNDIIYIFLSSEQEIFIFEDLDRFNEPIIYEKLVEINTLLNKRVSNRKTIKFIYLLRDDIFKSKERTKIFDFIIPIVPIIAYGNSYNKFEELITEIKKGHLTENNNKNVEEHKFDSKFIQKILLYIDDMRLLKNIINEYFLYYKIINQTQLDSTKLFSILIYKNVFPRDFYQFQYNKSYIDHIFSKREMLVEQRLNENENRIAYLEKSIKEYDESVLKKREEIEALYFPFYSYQKMKVNGMEVKKLDNNSDIIKLIKNNNYLIEVYDPNRYSSHHEENVENVFKKINEQITSDKYPFLFNYNNELKNELKELKYENEIAESSNMKELLESQDRSFFIRICSEEQEFNYLLEHEYLDLIIMLVREGFLNKESLDYISIQTDSKLDSNDRLFLRNVYDYHNDIEEFKLKNPEVILDKFEREELKQRKLLNIDLTKFMIKTQHNWLKDILYICLIKKDIRHIYNVLKSLKTEYLTGNNKDDSIISNINYFFKMIFENKQLSVLLDENFSIIDKETIIFVLKNIEDSLLTSIISLSGIKDHLESISFDYEDLQQLEDIFDKLANEKYSFKNINLIYNDMNCLGMYEKLIKNNFVAITKANIIAAIEMLSVNDSEEEKTHSNLSIFYQIPYPNIQKYFIKDNINEYLDVYLNFQRKNRVFKDKVQDVVTLLNNKNIEPHLIYEYLDNYEPLIGFTLSDDIPSKFLGKILELDLYELSAENINYIVHNGYLKISDLSEKICNYLEEIQLENIDDSIIGDLLSSILIVGINQQGRLLRHLSSSNPELLIRVDIDEIKSVSIELLIQLISNERIDILFRKSMFIKYIEQLKLEQILEYLKELNFDKKLMEVLGRGRKRIKISEGHKIILDHFEELGLLGKYEIDKKDDSLYYVSGKDLSINKDYSHINLTDYLSEQ